MSSHIGFALVISKNAMTSLSDRRLLQSAGWLEPAAGSSRAARISRTVLSAGMYVLTIFQIPSSVLVEMILNFRRFLTSQIYSPAASRCVTSVRSANPTATGDPSSTPSSSSSSSPPPPLHPVLSLFNTLLTAKFLAVSDFFFRQSCNKACRAALWNSDPDARRARIVGRNPI